MMSVYRVVDVQCNNTSQRCYVYLRDKLGTRYTIHLPCVYEYTVGFNTIGLHNKYLSIITSAVKDKLRVECLGNKETYFRRKTLLYKLTCDDYRCYIKVQKTIEFSCHNQVFICEQGLSIEDYTMHRAGIYGCSYVRIEDSKVFPAEESEHFYYTPRVAGIDLEMLSLNAVDPTCEIYAASFYMQGCNTVVYSSSYIDANLEPEKDYKFTRASNRTDVISKLSSVVDYHQPDVIVWYNGNHADGPMCYYALGQGNKPWSSSDPNVLPYFQRTRKIDYNKDTSPGICIKIGGTQTIDMLEYVRSTMSSSDKVSCSLGDVCMRLFGETKDPYDWIRLSHIYYHGSVDDKKGVLRYCARDSYLTVRLYEHFNVWNFHSSSYNNSGIDGHRAMLNGKLMTTYGMIYRESKRYNIILDPSDNAIFKPGGGLVLEPEIGCHSDVSVVDATSMYPNIAIQHNIDSNTKERNIDYISSLPAETCKCKGYYSTLGHHDEIHILVNSRGDQVYYRQDIKGMLPIVLKGLLDNRSVVKQQIQSLLSDESYRQPGTQKGLSKEGEYKKSILVGKELAYKVDANGACGGLGEQSRNNPISDCESNDVITHTGQSILRVAISVATKYNILVVYGDTDSLMIKDSSHKQEFLDELHSILPSRMRFKEEYSATKFFIGSRKHYIYIRDGQIFSVGYKSSKSSSSKASASIYNLLLGIIFEHGPEACIQAYQVCIDDLCKDSDPNPELFTTSFSISGKVYLDSAYKGKVISLMRGRGVDVSPGNTYKVVTVLSIEEYINKYKSSPPILLPSIKSTKAERIFTLEEISTCPDVIDIRSMIDMQCGSVIYKIANRWYPKPGRSQSES